MSDELRNEFEALFGNQPSGCDVNRVVHSQESPRIVTLCRAGLECPTAELHAYFKEWDGSVEDRKPRQIERLLAINGRWEAAWSLARLHVDQIVKQEITSGVRIAEKGHPLCNVALLGRDLQCRALVQHYAQLSRAGDFYRDAGRRPTVHGLAPVLLEPFESRKRHEEWRAYVSNQLATDTQQPLFLEAYVAARWFRGAHREWITRLAPMSCGHPPSFVDVLLDAVVNWTDKKNTTGQGTLFESACGLLLSATPGFIVYPCRWNKDEQIDLVVRYEPDAVAPPCLPLGYGLVECKGEKGLVDSAKLRDFGAKCLFHRVQFGILVARSGIRGGGAQFQDPTGAELARRRFLSDGLTLLVLDIDHLRGQDRELRGLHDALFDDYQRLVFGRIVGEE